MKKDFFKDKVVILTGASSGIGRELALQLAKEGAKLSLAARSVDKLKEIADECQNYNSKVLLVATDVTKSEDCKNLIEKTVEKFATIDILINNAGKSMNFFFEETTDLSVYEKLMQVNYLGAMYCTFYALPYLKKNQGQIVTTSSLAGFVPAPSRSGYTASKAALTLFFDTLRIELKQYRVSVTQIFPSFVQTAMRKNAYDPKGETYKQSPAHESGMMPVQQCAKIMLHAISKRRRSCIITFEGKLAYFLRALFPNLLDKLALKKIKSVRVKKIL